MKKPFQILLIDLGSSRAEINEPIGICSLYAYLKKYLTEPVEIQLKFFPISQFPTKEELTKYDVVGLSTKIGCLNKIASIYSLLQQIPSNQRPLLVLGDLIATFATEQLLAKYTDAICVVGEGEETFLKLIEFLIENQLKQDDLFLALFNQKMPNLAFRLNGRYQKTNRKLVDLNNCLPPDRSFVKSIRANGGIIRAEASRGCAYGKCRFCAIQHKYCDEARWRDVGLSRILNELEQLSNLGVKNPFYTDEDFIGNAPHRAIALADKIIEAKKNDKIEACMTLYVDMRVDSILAKARNNAPSGKEVLQKLKKAGLREVFIGIESGAKEQVKRYRKPSTTERNIQVLQLLKELDISVDIGFIMFDPEMSLDELFANIHFIKACGLNYHDARLTKCLRIEPKTPMVEDYQKKGLISGKLDLNELIYPYRWANGKVEDIYHVLSHWENQWMNEVYTIQAATRGEVPSEELRKQWRIGLGKIRSVEIEVLERLAQSVSKAVNPEAVDLEEYTEKKERMVTTLLNQIQ